jgi:hypothetical protein
VEREKRPMTVVFWVFALVLSVVLAVMMGRAGWIKTFTPLVSMAGSGLVWVRDIPAWSVRLIGMLELLAAIVVVVAPVARLVVGPDPLLTIAGVAAALGVATLMGLAHLFHRARGESEHTWKTNLAFGALAVMTAAAQFVAG